MLDLVNEITRLENDELSLGEVIRLFGKLVRTGAINELQGSYGRTAAELVAHGYLYPTGAITGRGFAIIHDEDWLGPTEA